MDMFKSDISGKEYPVSERVPANSIRNELLEMIQKENPGFTRDSVISETELSYWRNKYIQHIMVNEIGELGELEKIVLENISNDQTLSGKVQDQDQEITSGQRLADKIATFGGSWTFIISFFAFILIWMSINIFQLVGNTFDPYPFILLNLILSCLAALQAPVIMMSQNRKEEKDRDRSKQDYMINLKSELEIRMIHEKLDHLIMHQQQELLEIQRVQIDALNEILEKVRS